jgi:hypothetical protein
MAYARTQRRDLSHVLASRGASVAGVLMRRRADGARDHRLLIEAILF